MGVNGAQRTAFSAGGGSASGGSVQKTQNAYLLTGNSSFLKEEALQKIKKDLFCAGLTKVDIESFHAEENTICEVLDAIRTLPLFSSRRLVILRDIDIIEKSQLRALISYLKEPQKSSTLVLVTQDEKIPPSWTDTFKGLCQILSLDAPYENQLDSWIAERVRQTDKKIDPPAAGLLKDLIGADLRILTTEIEKLILYAGERSLISRQDVERLAAQSIHYSVFILGDALADRDLSKSLSVLARILEERKTPHEIVGWIYWQFQRMLKAKEGRMPQFGSSFLVRKFSQQLSKWEIHQLREALRSLQETDIAIKTGRWPGPLALEEWFVRTLTEPDASSAATSSGRRYWDGSFS